MLVPEPFLVKPPVPETPPLKVVLYEPVTVTRLPPLVTFPLTCKLPAAAFKVWPPLKTIGTFNVWALAELLVTPVPLLPKVNKLPPLAVMLKLLAPLLKVTPATT